MYSNSDCQKIGYATYGVKRKIRVETMSHTDEHDVKYLCRSLGSCARNGRFAVCMINTDNTLLGNRQEVAVPEYVGDVSDSFIKD